ncbi:MAG: DoxX family protein [Acidobacteriota bacterium]
MNSAWLTSRRGTALSVMRIVISSTFMAHGLQKTLGLLGGKQVPFLSLVGVAGYIELIGGILLLIGLFTRPVAFVLCGLMAVAYFMQHAPNGFWPIVNHGELAVLYCFIFLYLFFSGAGPWSLDAVLHGGGGRN